MCKRQISPNCAILYVLTVKFEQNEKMKHPLSSSLAINCRYLASALIQKGEPNHSSS